MSLKKYLYGIFLRNIFTEYFSRIFVQYGEKKNYNDELFGICVMIGNYRDIYFKERIYN